MFGNATYMTQDAANFFWNDDTNRLGIGTTAPGATLDVQGGIRLGSAGAANSILNITSGTATTNDLYWGDDLVCDASETSCGWLTSASITLQAAYEGGNTVQLSAGQGDVRFYNDGGNEMLFLDEDTGRVGIGNTAPTATLDITGGITASSTVTFSGLGTGTDNTVVILNGSNQLTTDEIDSRVWGSTLVDTSSGSANYITKFSDGDTLANSVIYESGGNIGIGTTAPSSFKLQLAGSIGPNSNDTYDLGSDSLRWQDLYLGPGSIHLGTSTSDEYVMAYDTTNNRLGFNVNGSGNPEIVMNSSGYVGIGTTSPDKNLTIYASGTKASIGLKSSDGSGSIIYFGDNATYDSSITYNASVGSAMEFRTGGSPDNVSNTRMIIDNSGNVGIGTTGPSGRLQVAGDEVRI